MEKKMSGTSFVIAAAAVVFVLLLSLHCCDGIDLQKSNAAAASTFTSLPRQIAPGLHSTSVRGLADHNCEHVIRAELLHRDHMSSPLGSTTPKSLSDRILEAVKRSIERRDYIERNMKAAAAAGSGLESWISAGEGEYFMEIALGSPPQTLITIVDTGSDLVWVQCSPCSACFPQTGPNFEPAKSKTYRTASCDDRLCLDLPIQSCAKSSCKYEYQYGDGSMTIGAFSYESLTLESSGGKLRSLPQIAFGCGQMNSGSFAGAGGIVGLGRGAVSLPSQLSPSISDKFSYCLVNLETSATNTSPIFFGDIAAAQTSTSAARLKYTPLINNPKHPTFYYVGVNGISVGGQMIAGLSAQNFTINTVGNGGVIFDSGTTLTIWNSNVYTLILQAYRSAIDFPIATGGGYGLDLCYDTSGHPSAVLPEMVIYFDNDVQLHSPATSMFLSAEGDVKCLAMLGAVTDFSVIGNLQQQDHLLVFDNVNQRMGLASANCASL